MALNKTKLVLRAPKNGSNRFTIVKAINTLAHGVPGDYLNREEMDKLIKSDAVIRYGTLTVEILEK